MFLKHVVEKLLHAIECIQMDDEFGFTNNMGNSKIKALTLFEKTSAAPGIQYKRFVPLPLGTTARWAKP